MKPTREEMEAELLAFIEGELPPDAAARVEIYLDNTDPKLAQRVRDMIADRQALQALPKLNAPADLSARIMEQVERTSLIGGVEDQLVIAPRRSWHARLAVAASLLIALSIFGYFVIDSITRKPNEWEGGTVTVAKGTADHELAAVEKKEGVSGKMVALDNPSPAISPPVITLNNMNKDNSKALDGWAKNDLNHAEANAQAPSPQIALESVGVARGMRQNSAAPAVVLTLLARDSQDSQRLRAALEQYILADADHLEAKDKQLAANRKIDANQQIAGGQLKQQLDQNYKYRDQKIALQQPVIEPAPIVRGKAAVSKSAAPRLVVKFTGDPQAPYLVRLRPEQIDELTRNFTVQTIARGDNSYLIANNYNGTNSLNGNNTFALNNTQNFTNNTGIINNTGNLYENNNYDNSLNRNNGNISINGIANSGAQPAEDQRQRSQPLTMSGSIAPAIPTTQPLSPPSPAAPGNARDNLPNGPARPATLAEQVQTKPTAVAPNAPAQPAPTQQTEQALIPQYAPQAAQQAPQSRMTQQKVAADNDQDATFVDCIIVLRPLEPSSNLASPAAEMQRQTPATK